MNYITHREAVSVFPHLTFEKQIFYVCSKERLGNDWKPSWVDKYRKRGYLIDTSSLDPLIDTGRRTVKDKNSWVIKADGKVPLHFTRRRFGN